MLTRYPKDINRWKDWQKLYRYGVFLIIPPDPPFSRVEKLRIKYDPESHAVCCPHISVTIPLPRSLSESNWFELKTAVSGLKPFRLDYGPLINYLPHPGVCLAVGPVTDMDKLRAALENTAALRNAAPRSYPFSPHMTIAENITAERTLELMTLFQDVPLSGSFLCTAVSFCVPDEHFRFSERGRLDFY
jgi:2'-5' RNA ligase